MSHALTTQLTDALVRGLPKVELHVHLEGTLERERIAEIAAELGEPLPRPVHLALRAPVRLDLVPVGDSHGLEPTGRPPP